jgi:hypothetical protein
MRSGLALVLLLAATSLTAGEKHSGHTSMETHGPVTDCADVRFRFDGSDAARGEDQLTVPGRDLTLALADSKGIPVRVTGSDRSGYGVRLCKGAESNAALASIRLEQKGSRISVSGPDSDRWNGYLIVSAPRDGNLDLDSGNGPVSVSDVAGRVQARLQNGPLSLKNVGGAVDAAVVNGPLTFSGKGGSVRLDAKNGPVSITLDGSTWEGRELRAAAENGPVTLRLPENYGSGVSVERGSHSPFHCAASLCGAQGSERPGQGERQLTIGSGATRVHLASDNGPVSIKTR